MKITLDQYQKMLVELELSDVLEMMVRSSGRDWAEVGRDVGWTEAVVNRIRDRNDPDYMPSSSRLEEFCVRTNSVLLADWLKARSIYRLNEIGLPRPEKGALTCQSIMFLVAPVMTHAGDLAGEVGRTVEEGAIEPKKKRRLTRQVLGVIDSGLKLLQRLSENGRNGIEHVREGMERRRAAKEERRSRKGGK
jgi:hypothetical protein